MKSFEYVIKDQLGVHARPAGLLVKEGKKYDSTISIKKGDKTVDTSRLLALMGLGIKCGETITVEVEGTDEDAAYEGIKNFFESNL